ncbi:UPF0280 family protein [Geoglobus acetivorans]|uniref:UPF0280 family protein n=1 Tax=Geoglobus acetivorans TaxID=565033 RepID=A0ABZ3H3Y2_GEOAI|nr:UPF0280 family protein [Geoglobus acetivorans]
MNYRRYHFRFKQTITTILARDDETYRKAVAGMMYAREKIEEHIALNPIFLTSLEPLDCCGEVVGRMCAASRVAGVGPMAAVAATVAWYGVERADSDFIVIDNGGDIVIKNDESITIGIYAGNRTSVGFEIEGDGRMKSVCTSSGKIGPSISFGFADAATVFSDNPAVADAFATALGNRIKDDHGKREISEVLEEFWKSAKKYVDGALVIKDDVLAYVGEIPELKTVKIEPDLITKG